MTEVWYVADESYWQGHLRVRSGYIAEDLGVQNSIHHVKLVGKPDNMAYQVYPSKDAATFTLREIMCFVKRVRGLRSLLLDNASVTLLED